MITNAGMIGFELPQTSIHEGNLCTSQILPQLSAHIRKVAARESLTQDLFFYSETPTDEDTRQAEKYRLQIPSSSPFDLPTRYPELHREPDPLVGLTEEQQVMV